MSQFLPSPSALPTQELVDSIPSLRRMIYKPGYNFAEAGVHLIDLQCVEVQQGELALDAGSADRSALMQAMNKISATDGKRSLSIASAGIEREKREWEMRQDLRTPLYTTNLRDIPVAFS